MSAAKTARSSFLSRPAVLIPTVLFLLGAHGLLAYTATAEKSSTFDEVVDLTAGYAILTTEDFRLAPDHPHLAQIWAAWPLLFDRLAFPDLNGISWRTSDTWALGAEFLYQLGNDAHAMLRKARSMMILLSIAFGGVIFAWSRRLFGPAGALVSLTLYALSPTILAHARLVTTDLTAAMLLTCSAGALWRLARRITLSRILLAGLALAALCLTKMSAVLILPVAALLLLIRALSSEPLHVSIGKKTELRSTPARIATLLAAGLAVALVAWAGIWSAYGFRYSAFAPEHAHAAQLPLPDWGDLPQGTSSWEYTLRDNGPIQKTLRWLRDHRLAPEAYLYGAAFTAAALQSSDAFLNGERQQGGWWYFFPVCFALKTALPILGILLAAIAARWHSSTQESRPALQAFLRCAPLWCILAVYSTFALTSSFNLGHRLILPIYPPLFILAGACATWINARSLFARGLIPALLVCLAASSATAWPHYLAYFNAFAGGPANGHKHLVDSSLDWGQDLIGLKHWLDQSDRKAHPGPIYLSYFGTASPAYEGIDARMLPAFPPPKPLDRGPWTGGTYCISATMLEQVFLLPTNRWTIATENAYRRLGSASALSAPQSDMFLKLAFARLCAFLREREPDHRIGYSILIFLLDDQTVNRYTRDQPPELLPDDEPTLQRLREFASECGLGESDLFGPTR